MAKTLFGATLTILGIVVLNFGLYQNIPFVISHPDPFNASCTGGIESINEGACAQTHSENISPIGAAYYTSSVAGIALGLTMVILGVSSRKKRVMRRAK